jgi:MFS family permease
MNGRGAARRVSGNESENSLMPLGQKAGGAYRWYALAILTTTYALNLIDRHIVTVLAPYIKADLHIGDAQYGLLYGTAFALFYGLFGIPLARFGDAWLRVRTLAIGLFVWSLVTALSGLATSFLFLGLARIGVGLGEASSSPAAVSLLGEYFTKQRRATALAVYGAGATVGFGAAAMIGGEIVAKWQSAFGTTALAPFHLSGWRVTFLAVAIPGFILSLIISLTLREPKRVLVAQDGAWVAVLREVASMVPPFSLYILFRNGHFSVARRNLLVLVTIAAASLLLGWASEALLPPSPASVLGHVLGLTITASRLQWSALGFAVYGLFSWSQFIRIKDPVAHELVVSTPAFLVLSASSGLISATTYAVLAFFFLYATRYFAFRPHDGVLLGLISALTSTAGMVVGGILGDYCKRWAISGRLYYVMVAMFLFLFAGIVTFTTRSAAIFVCFYALMSFFYPMATGCVYATGQDLVLPRMYGLSFSVITVTTSVLGLGLGPYLVGLISDTTGDLRFAVLCSFAALPVAVLGLGFVSTQLKTAESTVAQRADSLGEPRSSH